MFSYLIDLADFKYAVHQAWDAQWRKGAGVVFMLLAVAAIQYDEVIAPELSRWSDALSSVSSELGRKVTGL